MNESDAADLLRPAVAATPGAHWADLGAGTGTFTRALAALLGPDAHLYAVDADERALRSIRAWAEGTPDTPAVRILPGDFTRRLPLPPLDGIVMANALHFVRDQPAAVALAASYLRPGGRLVAQSTRTAPPAAGCRTPSRPHAWASWRRTRGSRPCVSSRHGPPRTAGRCTSPSPCGWRESRPVTRVFGGYGPAAII
jgi:SAM-dependent methyltransferase